MAGIGRFPDGFIATAGDSYWSVGKDGQLHFVLEVDDTEVSDYGSDIGIDPAIKRGDRIKYIELTDYMALWTVADASTEDADSRVRRNRRFAEALPSDTDALMPWLAELATQTRRVVLFGDEKLMPGPVSDLKRFSPEVREWLAEDRSRLQDLTDSGFERLVADILRDMDFTVCAVGHTHRKDGGVDIAAWPKSGLPYLIAVQVKHSRRNRKVGVKAIREFAGVLDRNPVFRFGLVVTNSTFTDDAREWQSSVQSALRLRDGIDLQRWLAGDFISDAEWKEIPSEVSLGLGVSFPVKDIQPSSDDAFWKSSEPSHPLRQFLELLK